MKGYELVQALNEDFREWGTAGSRVVVINDDTNEVYIVKSTTVEHHDDADGSTTHWIHVVDY